MNTDHDWKRGFRTTPLDLTARISAALDAGLPAEFADRLNGDTEDALRSDALALAQALTPTAPTQEVDMTTPEPTDTTTEETPPDDIDPVERHRAAMAGQPPDTDTPLELHRTATRY